MQQGLRELTSKRRMEHRQRKRFFLVRIMVSMNDKELLTDNLMAKWFLPGFFGIVSFLFVCVCLFLRRETADEVNLNQGGEDRAQTV